MSAVGPAPVDVPSGKTRMQRMLDGIERLGNKMPDPAILFIWLCVGVIVLSQILYWADVKVTYEVVKPPPVPPQEAYYGGSIVPVDVAPAEPQPPPRLQARDRDRRGPRAC